jgi:hypothetical protein
VPPRTGATLEARKQIADASEKAKAKAKAKNQTAKPSKQNLPLAKEQKGHTTC